MVYPDPPLVLPCPIDPKGPPADSGATSVGGLPLRTHPSGEPPGRLLAICLAVASGFWGLAALRHALLQSNSFDLGLFDQWVWLISRGLAQVSSQSADLPLLTDHGDWLLYGLAPHLCVAADRVQWLLGLQALSLALTAVPLWILARDAGLSQGLRWTVCGLCCGGFSRWCSTPTCSISTRRCWP